MAEFQGTAGTDMLLGTSGADIFIPLGTNITGESDFMSGGDGADIYNLVRTKGAINSFIIDDAGQDGAHDAIIGLGALYQTASLGYKEWATAVRVGDDLIIDTPGRPDRLHNPGTPAAHIEIRSQYGGGGAPVETFEAGGVTYWLATGDRGTHNADLMAGGDMANTFRAGAGDDFLFGNGGNDRLIAGAGSDVAFGGDGNDRLKMGGGNDQAYGGVGDDRLIMGGGSDQAYGGDGNDILRGGGGFDYLHGEAGNDRLFGQAGRDVLIGGGGNDMLSGGTSGDLYQFDAGVGFGRDRIIDRGNQASFGNYDVVEISGVYNVGSTPGEAFAKLDFSRVGNHLMISIDGGASQIRVLNMFDADQDAFFVESFRLTAGYWTPLNFQFVNGEVTAIGDDRDYSLIAAGLTSWANEIMFGTDQDESIFGGSGANFIWTGDGADVLVYKENDPDLLLYTSMYGYGGGVSHDIVADFDVAQDRLDFTEIDSITSLADLVITADADGDALISWDSGDIEIADILIELRGVTLDEITTDMFLFI